MEWTQETAKPVRRLPGLTARTVFLTLLALLLILGLRTLILAVSPVQLFFDEAQYWSWGQDLDFGYFSKPPLLAWILRGFSEICGNGEACVRFASPALYSVTAVFCGLLSARLAVRHDLSANAAFFWASLLFVTLPGVSFAASLISTDVPLLLCFAMALYFLDRLSTSRSSFDAVALGVAIGLGLMAKYAMAYFILCTLLWCVFSRRGRHTVFQARMLLTISVTFLCVLPNILWNAARNWITFQHTQDNANWQGLTLHFDNMAEFTGAQIGILGPVLFVVILVGLFSKRSKMSETVHFLLCFSLPVTLVMIAQATLSRAHANWAAVSFLAYTVLATYWLVKWRARTLLFAAIGLNILVLGALSAGDLYADRLKDHPIGYSYKRVFGWQELADAVAQTAEKAKARTIVSDRRSLTAQFLYYLRNEPYEIRTWAAEGRPNDHFEMSIPLTDESPTPILIVSHCKATASQADLQTLAPITIVVRPGFSRTVYSFLSNSSTITRSDFC